MRRTTRPAPFQRRGCGLSSDLLGPRRAFTVTRRPLTLSTVIHGHARVGLCTARSAAHDTHPRGFVPRRLTREPRTPKHLPVKAEGSEARECLPSCRDPASRDPQAGQCAERLELRLIRAPIRRLSTRAPRQAVLRASSRLAPSRPTRSCDLTARKTRDASNRLLPPERNDVHPCIVCSRLPRTAFAIREAPRTPRVRAARPRVVDDSRVHDRFRWIESPSREILRLRPHGLRSPAWACSSHGARCDPLLTSLSRPPLDPRAPRAFARATS
jgi:hypothetical protein